MPLIFATRPSTLARWQTQSIIHALQEVWPGLECEEDVLTTSGDRILGRPLPEIGGKGLFTQELENALLSGSVHAAVHSLKDLPVENAPGLIVAAIPLRDEMRDVLVSAQGYSLDTLPTGARVGTSSLRRAAQLLAHRPDLRVIPLRGNVDTRLRKALDGLYDAIVLAGAGLIRLGLAEYITHWLPLDVMTPAPGQGALAVQCRAGDIETQQRLVVLDDPATRMAVTAERAFLAGLGGGCSLPVAAFALVKGEQITLQGVVSSPDGQRLLRMQDRGSNPDVLGTDLARQAIERGASELLTPSINNKSALRLSET
ncbi:MAG: hydroxymethylbilane synthase [Chloroflexi bacterium RBG_16_54_18]|nr:MAG: hydroxymethylbilane synthase [Chloroflexi bacterium RBG_16_54_18]HLE51283.1 hydroxymethylbilane synthase [Anaerolineales bacterium]